jgi:hypothetical protein
MEYLHHVSFGIGVLGALVIVSGVADGLARLLRSEVLSARGRNIEQHRKRLRIRLNNPGAVAIVRK